MKAISLWNPWASWVILGWKTIETREHDRFKSLAGQQILIHAAKRWDPTAMARGLQYLSPGQLHRSQDFKLVHGVLLGTAWVTEHRKLTVEDEEAALIECTSPRYGLFLSQVAHWERAIEYTGRQGIFDVPLLECPMCDGVGDVEGMQGFCPQCHGNTVILDQPEIGRAMDGTTMQAKGCMINVADDFPLGVSPSCFSAVQQVAMKASPSIYRTPAAYATPNEFLYECFRFVEDKRYPIRLHNLIIHGVIIDGSGKRILIIE